MSYKAKNQSEYLYGSNLYPIEFINTNRRTDMQNSNVYVRIVFSNP